MRVSIVIPNYNSGEQLIKNLPGIMECGAREVIVLDDGSRDDSVKQIKNENRKKENGNLKLKILENERTLGFASTVNRGVKEASGEIVVLLNTDVVPEKDFLKPLLVHFNDPKVFAVGCMDKSMENGKIILRGRGLAKWQRGFYVHSRGEVNKTDTAWVSCGSGAFRKKIWERLDGLDEIYNPFYWEDIDLSFRAKKAGYNIIFEPTSVVVHQHEKGSIRQNYSPFEIKTIAYRNQFIFSWKNMDELKLWFTHFFWLPYHFLKAVLSYDRAFFWGFFGALASLSRIVKSKK